MDRHLSFFVCVRRAFSAFQQPPFSHKDRDNLSSSPKRVNGTDRFFPVQIILPSTCHASPSPNEETSSCRAHPVPPFSFDTTHSLFSLSRSNFFPRPSLLSPFAGGMTVSEQNRDPLFLSPNHLRFLSALDRTTGSTVRVPASVYHQGMFPFKAVYLFLLQAHLLPPSGARTVQEHFPRKRKHKPVLFLGRRLCRLFPFLISIPPPWGGG